MPGVIPVIRLLGKKIRQTKIDKTQNDNISYQADRCQTPLYTGTFNGAGKYKKGTPITGIAACCASAASGGATVPSVSLHRNARRFISISGRPSRHDPNLSRAANFNWPA